MPGSCWSEYADGMVPPSLQCVSSVEGGWRKLHRLDRGHLWPSPSYRGGGRMLHWERHWTWLSRGLAQAGVRRALLWKRRGDACIPAPGGSSVERRPEKRNPRGLFDGGFQLALSRTISPVKAASVPRRVSSYPTKFEVTGFPFGEGYFGLGPCRGETACRSPRRIRQARALGERLKRVVAGPLLVGWGLAWLVPLSDLFRDGKGGGGGGGSAV